MPDVKSLVDDKDFFTLSRSESRYRKGEYRPSPKLFTSERGNLFACELIPPPIGWG